jgi:hypothetical protein
MEGTKIRSQEDTDTKTFNLYGQFLMGFTGLARIDDLRMERWVSDILQGAPTEEYFNILAREINAAFDRLGLSGRLPHAFQAVGYGRLEPDGSIYPLCITISNSVDPDGFFSRSALAPGFRVHVESLGNRRQAIGSVGWPMRESISRALAHRVRVVCKGDAGNPSLSVSPLVMALRDTARVSANHVGNAVLFASLPRCAVPSPGMTAGKVDYRRQAVSLFIPEAARGPEGGMIYMPAIINPQMHIYGFRIYPGPPIPPMGKQEGWF